LLSAPFLLYLKVPITYNSWRWTDRNGAGLSKEGETRSFGSNHAAVENYRSGCNVVAHRSGIGVVGGVTDRAAVNSNRAGGRCYKGNWITLLQPFFLLSFH